MKKTLLLAFACATVAAGASAQQALVCPPGSAVTGKSCEAFHYHVQAYRPDTRKFAEIAAINPLATQAACERVRDAHMKRNLAIVDYFKRVKGEQNYEPDRVGQCHCDMTRDRTNPAYLADAQRTLQIRTAEDIRLRVREKLLDSGLTSDSELLRSLVTPPPTLPVIGGSKLVPIAASTAVSAVSNSADDLKATTAVDTRPPAPAALDLPLVDVAVAATPAVPPAPAGAQPQVAATSDGAAPTLLTEQVEAPPGDTDRDVAPAEGAAEAFIAYETERIQNVLKAAGAISDENVKSKIFEASLQRTQLLSNLRTLIEGSGARSRLANAARSAQSEEAHLAFAEMLFGKSVAPHWAPKDAADVILAPSPEVDGEPERVLRDATGRFSDDQKKRALYLMLARTQPTEEQQLWLITVVDSFLR